MFPTNKGKAESIWDRVAHTKQNLFLDDSDLEDTDNQNSTNTFEKKMLYTAKGIPMYRVKFKKGPATVTGDVACNSYYKIDEDIILLKELGVSNRKYIEKKKAKKQRSGDRVFALIPLKIHHHNNL